MQITIDPNVLKELEYRVAMHRQHGAPKPCVMNPKPATHNYPKSATDSTGLPPSVLGQSNAKPSDGIHHR